MNRLMTIADLLERLEPRRNPHEKDHSRRVGLIAAQLARMIGMAEPEIETLFLAARLHDLGKLDVDKSILNKSEPLNDLEMNEIRKHPDAGHAILQDFVFLDEYQVVADVVRHHHENLDGSGYPDGLSNDDLSVYARIVRIADSFIAMTSDRPCRAKLTRAQALAKLRNGAGSKYDPDLLAAFGIVVERAT